MGIIERFYKNILYYQIEGFNSDENMNHLFSSRIGWDQDKLFENLRDLLDVPLDRIYSAKQVHGTDVAVLTSKNISSINIGEKDGLLTDLKGIVLCTYHADCVPIYYYDSEKSVVGVAHAGWKGTLNNINKVMIGEMTNTFKCDLAKIKVAIGPSIGPCCYEIGHDVEELFRDTYPNYPDIILEKENKIYLDLWKVNYINLLNIGLNKENLYLGHKCTSCNVDKLYSYRKEKGTKNRMIAGITLEP